jgi:hypothetical protein
MSQDSKLVSFLLDRNKEQSQTFTSSDAVLWRRQYRAKYPTEIAALKCMDGRLNLALMTETPQGIIQPFRNIGGIFDLGWPFFGILMREWVEYAVSQGRNCLVLVTYHFSKGDPHRGCKGFAYDVSSAQKATEKLRRSFEHAFGPSHHIVYPIMVGIETDSDALILHGAHGTLNMFSEVDLSKEDLILRLRALYPDMGERILHDFVPLLRGNQRHIRSLKAEQRTVLDSDHREQILGIGRGFDWLHLPNKALLVGPYSYDLRTPISTAASILLDNLEQGRIPKNEGVVLMTSAVYRSAGGPEVNLAEDKARSLSAFALNAIEKDVPALMPYLTSLAGIVDMNTRHFHRLDC